MKKTHNEEMDYRGMYLKMINACEDAINLLIDAQRECEEMYMQAPPEILSEDELQEIEGRLDRTIEQLEENDAKLA